MRSTQLITGALAVAATCALIGLGAAPGNAQILNDQAPDPMTPGVTHERGKLLECTGTVGRTAVRANIYQNRTYGNHLEVLVDDGTPTSRRGRTSCSDRSSPSATTAGPASSRVTTRSSST